MKKKNIMFVKGLAVIAVFIMVANIGYEVFSTIRTTYSISQAKKEQAQLKGEETKLQNEVAKLNDEKYLQSYVSGTIFSTEKGTTIFILPDQEETPE